MSRYYFVRFGAAYGEGTYGSSVYSCDSATNPECTTSTPAGNTDTGSGSGGSGLADTGIMLVAFATLACLIIFTAMIVRFVRRRPQLLPQEINDQGGDVPPPEEGPELPSEPPRPI